MATNSYQHSHPGENGIKVTMEAEDIDHRFNHRGCPRILLVAMTLMAAVIYWMAVVDYASTFPQKQQKQQLVDLDSLTMSHHNDNRDNSSHQTEKNNWYDYRQQSDNGNVPDWNDEKGRYNWQKCLESDDPDCWEDEGDRVHNFWQDFGLRMKTYWQNFRASIRNFFHGGDKGAQSGAEAGEIADSGDTTESHPLEEHHKNHTKDHKKHAVEPEEHTDHEPAETTATESDSAQDTAEEPAVVDADPNDEEGDTGDALPAAAYSDADGEGHEIEPAVAVTVGKPDDVAVDESAAAPEGNAVATDGLAAVNATTSEDVAAVNDTLRI
ncbi:expressed unknown protein [Seminavis robusta]|uniref:Transmembrane protein n=1 Tax=Seminavis robusta TaxID=568900 RepID=A0A9N8DI02_9STRA|nr:expressed unknown protein [Seminavis robusta]|eukprot:Sro137_g064530.1 n/a (325) ;mRNA; f:91929-92903